MLWKNQPRFVVRTVGTPNIIISKFVLMVLTKYIIIITYHYGTIAQSFINKSRRTDRQVVLPNWYFTTFSPS